MIKFPIALAALTLWAGSSILGAAESQLSSYAQPGADIMIFFDTEQPHKAMDPQLWNRIQRDKKRALAAAPEKPFFDIAGRSMAAVINVFVQHHSPLRLNISGVAKISGDVQKDLAKLVNSARQDKLTTPRQYRQKNQDFYQFNFPAIGTLPPIKAELALTPEKLLHFNLTLNPTGKALPHLLKPAPRAQTGPERANWASAVLLQVNARKLKMLNFNQPQGPSIQNFLQQINTLNFRIKVQGKLAWLELDLNCLTPEIAQNFAHNIGNSLPQLTAYLNPKDPQKFTLKKVKNHLQLQLPVDLERSWETLSFFQNAVQNHYLQSR